MTADASQLTDAAAPASGALAALRDKALRAGSELEGAPPQEILCWALGEFHPDLVIASSMGDAVLVDMAAKIQPGVPVLFLDTGYHFAETIGTRDAVATVYPVDIVTVLPLATVAEQDAEHGPDLWQRQPDLCCALRKVEPLARGLSPYTAWASGIRRDEATTRRTIGVVEWDEKRSMVKVNPSTPTSPTTACWSTRSRTTATRRSAARRAPGGSRRARTPAPAAGRAPARPSAACTSSPRRTSRPVFGRNAPCPRRAPASPTAGRHPSGDQGTS